MKEFLSWVGVAVTLISYVPYFRDMFRGKTKPHAFTWFIWMLLTLIAFFAQISGGAGAGSYVLGLTAAISLVIFVTALVVGRKNIVKVDWLFLAGSILALFLWSVTESPFWSVILITVVDAVAFAPTFRKAWSKPWSETLITYLLSSVKFVFVILALEKYLIVTALYPFSLIIMNGLFVLMLVFRRPKVKDDCSKLEERLLEPELL
jgi:chromate transport protein ChrA